jgi:hypothetical protein
VNPQTGQEIWQAQQQDFESYERLSEPAKDRLLERQRHQAEQHGFALEDFWDQIILKPAEALSRFFWKPGLGWTGESQHQTRGAKRYRVRECYAAGEREWWPETR